MAEPAVNKTYSYFRIGGRTAEDLDRELEKRGPITHATGHRHPGATEIKFGGDVTYVEKGGQCTVGGTRVTLRTRIMLPRWSNRGKASSDLGFIWDTLSADIKRHEERHAEIARNHARQLERTLEALRPARTCDALEKDVAETTRRLLEDHDAEQLRFDQVEAANFDARMSRLLQYNMERKRK
nr:DUF922 domain-containing protein [Rhizobium populisoli]